MSNVNFKRKFPTLIKGYDALSQFNSFWVNDLLLLLLLPICRPFVFICKMAERLNTISYMLSKIVIFRLD